MPTKAILATVLAPSIILLGVDAQKAGDAALGTFSYEQSEQSDA